MLTERQKDILRRALRNDGGVRTHGGHEDRTAQILVDREFLRNVIPGYGSDYYITPEGRAALDAKPLRALKGTDHG